MATIKSIEEKARRYDEAIKTAKKINNEQRAQPFNIMTRVFPELKESEDERIRKEMIETLKNEAHEFPSSIIAEKSKSWIAYLEKQGNLIVELQKTYVEIGRLVKENCYLKEKQGEQKPNLCENCIIATNNCQKFPCAIRDNEQKPADEIKPIVVRDFNSVFSREQVEEIDKRIEESQRLYNAKLRDRMMKAKDFPMTD